jgi:hypothetical protein
MIRKIIYSIPLLFALNTNGQNVLKLTPGAILYVDNGVLVTVENMDFNNEGGIGSVGPLPSRGTFRFSGAINTNISGTGVGSCMIEIDKNGGILQLMNDIGISSYIRFVSGLLDLNNHNISFVYSVAGVTFETESSRVIGPTGGYMQFSRTLSVNSPNNPGNLGLHITPSQYYYIPNLRRGHQSQTGNLGNGYSILRYYDFITHNQTISGTLRFQYFDAELNGINENGLELWRSTDNINWTRVGFISRSSINNYVEKTGIADLSGRWTLAPAENFRSATPVQQQPIGPSAAIQQGKNNCKIWSNPANNSLRIDITATRQSKTIISLFDSKGALIRTQQNPLLPGNNLLTIDTKDLVAGIYYILTQWGDGQNRESARFLKL